MKETGYAHYSWLAEWETIGRSGLVARRQIAASQLTLRKQKSFQLTAWPRQYLGESTPSKQLTLKSSKYQKILRARDTCNCCCSKSTIEPYLKHLFHVTIQGWLGIDENNIHSDRTFLLNNKSRTQVFQASCSQEMHAVAPQNVGQGRIACWYLRECHFDWWTICESN